MTSQRLDLPSLACWGKWHKWDLLEFSSFLMLNQGTWRWGKGENKKGPWLICSENLLLGDGKLNARRGKIRLVPPCQWFNYFPIYTCFWSLSEQSTVGSPAVTVIIVARSVVVLIPIVMQLIFCFALMDEQAYLLQHKILIIFWTDA